MAGNLMALRPINGERRSAVVVAERKTAKQSREATKTEIDGIVANIDALTASIAALQVSIDGWVTYTDAQKLVATEKSIKELKATDKIAKDIARAVRSLIRATLQ